MELKAALRKLKESKEFKDLSKRSPDIFFSYALKMTESDKEQPWQLGFYHKLTNKIMTFIVEDTIKTQEEEEIFKKPETEINQIDMEKMKISISEIMEKTEEFQKKKYPKEMINKKIMLLQNLKKYGTIWNITYLTHSFNTLNIKVNPENGDILHHSLDSLMSLIKK